METSVGRGGFVVVRGKDDVRAVQRQFDSNNQGMRGRGGKKKKTGRAEYIWCRLQYRVRYEVRG